jgi:Ca-activated chloride channel family protein
LPHWFANPLALWLLSLLPWLGVVAAFARRRQKRFLALLGRIPALEALSTRRTIGQVLRGGCLSTGLSLLVLGIAGPQWGREPAPAAVPGRDLVVVLDASRSMLAEDVLPSRFARAQAALVELADTVERWGGHRLGLVVFAARAKLVCPLTHDYDHFREKVHELDITALPRELRAEAKGTPSGTRMGAGLRAAVEAQDPRFRGYQDVLMLSDGDDPARDDEWIGGAEQARMSGIPVYVVGIGDPQTGARIPAADGYLRYDGREVWTRLQEEPLDAIARRTGGAYVPARTEAPRLADLFRERIAPGPVHEESGDALTVYRRRYPWFLGAALGFLALDMALGPWPRRKKEPNPV